MPDNNPDDLFDEFQSAIADLDPDFSAVAGQLPSFTHGSVGGAPTRPHLRGPRRATPAIFRIRVDLEKSDPPIWRSLDVRSDMRLDELHHVLQAAFGWHDEHLHRFGLGGNPFDPDSEVFLCSYDVDEGENDGVPARDVALDETLREPGDVLRYCYDYGASWDLIIDLESVRPPTEADSVAVCVDGRRAAPPEGCGGLRNADDLAGLLDDPAYFDRDEVNQALSNPGHEVHDLGLDPQLIDVLDQLRGTEIGNDLASRVARLHLADRQSSAEDRTAALHPILAFLDHVGEDGLALTADGSLQPDDVRAAAAVLPTMATWIGPADEESQALPVLQFQESLDRLGLLREDQGRLLLSDDGSAVRGDPAALWQHLAAQLPFGVEGEIHVPAGLIALVMAASGPGEPIPLESIAVALNRLGWRADTEITAQTAGWVTQDTLDVLETIAGTDRQLSGWGTVTPVAAELARDAVFRGTA